MMQQSWSKHTKALHCSCYFLIDQGQADQFLQERLHPHNFVEACRSNGVPVVLRMQEGYDHSYYFIATFVGEHIAHHAKALKE